MTKTMHVRDFLRGGYQHITEETVVTKHGRPIGTWSPPWHMTEYAKYLRAKREAEKSSSR